MEHVSKESAFMEHAPHQYKFKLTETNHKYDTYKNDIGNCRFSTEPFLRLGSEFISNEMKLSWRSILNHKHMTCYNSLVKQ